MSDPTTAAPHRPLHNHTDEMLLELQQEHENRIKASKSAISAIDEELAHRYAHVFRRELDKRQRQYGDVTLPHPEMDGAQIKGSISRRIEWNSPELEHVVNWLMSPKDQGGREWSMDRVRGFFGIKFFVPERNYTAAAIDDALTERLNKARTVTVRPIAVEIVRKGG